MRTLRAISLRPSIDYDANGWNARALKDASYVYVADWSELAEPQPRIVTKAITAANDEVLSRSYSHFVLKGHKVG